MPKLKTNKSASKRFKLTKRGKLRRFRQGKRHLATGKSSNRRRKLSRPTLIKGKLLKIIKKLLPYG